MADTQPIPVHKSTPNIDAETYAKMYQHSIEQPDEFWNSQAEELLDWDKKWHTVSNCDFKQGKIAWFEGASLNVSYNCLDRHLKNNANKTALIWESDSVDIASKHISYQELYQQVCQFANGLKKLGVTKGDRVCLYMPMIVESVVAMLACARIGAIHSVVFGGFSANSLKSRILDAQCKIVITADGGYRGRKILNLKARVDEAVADCDCVEQVIVVENTKQDITWQAKDIWWHELTKDLPQHCDIEFFDAQTPLFILYTSGSTGTPKGVVHTSAGYLLYATITHKYVFDCQDDDVYWCTADIGWITGHTYGVYGPLSNGTTSVIYEGLPNCPTHSRCWDIIDKHQVNVFYTAPTLIRALQAEGDKYLYTTQRNSLRILGTVGEPIGVDTWHWYHSKVGREDCPVVDTWWQTETGGHMITTLPYAVCGKPGVAGLPFFGIEPELVNTSGVALEGKDRVGILVFKRSWPGQMHTLYNNHQRFIDTYFSKYPGKYLSGDGAHRDRDNHYKITGRIDDALNISGHLLGTADIESALNQHPSVFEAAVIGVPDKIKGQAIFAFVGIGHEQGSQELFETLVKLVRTEIGPLATIDTIQFAVALPKTRSGKIMRRILRSITQGKTTDFGDLSTLSEPFVVKMLVGNYTAKRYFSA